MYAHILDYSVRGYNLWLYVYTKCVYVYKTTVFINNVNPDIYLYAWLSIRVQMNSEF